MIKFGLRCCNDHEFEGWFGSSSDYESQLSRGLVSCPVCDSVDISKSLMAPAVVSGSSSPSKSNDGSSSSDDSVALLDSDRREVYSKMKELRDELMSHAEDVGRRFPEEARKIHYGESEARGIYGEADRDDIEDLIDEGISVLPLPSLPDDAN